ncbi:hypothetical protein KAR91_66665 [Candidatus Pacearchaeota archaeon]|nr:hypothetical protein [Candidatus Pacearchaeota archaeon]
MKIGDQVKIDKCEQCPVVVGKIVKITELIDEHDQIATPKNGRVPVTAILGFGRGRPQANRPSRIRVADLSLM